MLLEPVLPPKLGEMSEGCVEYPAMTIAMAPGEGIVLVFPRSLTKVDRRVVEAYEDVGPFPIPISKGIDLLPGLKPRREMPRRRVAFVLHDRPYFLRPRMALEVAPQHLAVLGELVERIRRVVDPYEGSTGSYEGYESLLLAFVHRKLTRREEEEGIAFS